MFCLEEVAMVCLEEMAMVCLEELEIWMVKMLVTIHFSF